MKEFDISNDNVLMRFTRYILGSFMAPIGYYYTSYMYKDDERAFVSRHGNFFSDNPYAVIPDNICPFLRNILVYLFLQVPFLITLGVVGTFIFVLSPIDAVLSFTVDNYFFNDVSIAVGLIVNIIYVAAILCYLCVKFYEVVKKYNVDIPCPGFITDIVDCVVEYHNEKICRKMNFK